MRRPLALLLPPLPAPSDGGAFAAAERGTLGAELKHAGADVPAQALLGTHEEEWVKLVGTGRRPKKCTIDGCACKA